MRAYEIRILHNGQVAAVHTASLLGDHAAVRRAHKLAQGDGAGDRVEVWRDQACIYAAALVRALAS